MHLLQGSSQLRHMLAEYPNHSRQEGRDLLEGEEERMTRVTVLGGGNTAFSMAASLSLAGNEVLLWEHPDFEETVEPIRETLTIQLNSPASVSQAKLAGVTTDPAEALAWADLLVCSVPSYAHEPFAGQLLPHLRPGHLLALLPGNLGSLVFAARLRQAGVTGVIVAESDTAPYVCRKTGPAEAIIWGTVRGSGSVSFQPGRLGK